MITGIPAKLKNTAVVIPAFLCTIVAFVAFGEPAVTEYSPMDINSFSIVFAISAIKRVSNRILSSGCAF